MAGDSSASMVHRCIAAGCSNRSSRDQTVEYHRLPKDPKLRRIWLRRIQRSPNLKLSDWSSARVCSKHFPDGVRTGASDCLPLVRSPGLVRIEKRQSGKKSQRRVLSRRRGCSGKPVLCFLFLSFVFHFGSIVQGCVDDKRIHHWQRLFIFFFGLT